MSKSLRQSAATDIKDVQDVSRYLRFLSIRLLKQDNIGITWNEILTFLPSYSETLNNSETILTLFFW